jgi:hypothetical protein
MLVEGIERIALLVLLFDESPKYKKLDVATKAS